MKLYFCFLFVFSIVSFNSIKAEQNIVSENSVSESIVDEKGEEKKEENCGFVMLDLYDSGLEIIKICDGKSTTEILSFKVIAFTFVVGVLEIILLYVLEKCNNKRTHIL